MPLTARSGLVDVAAGQDIACTAAIRVKTLARARRSAWRTCPAQTGLWQTRIELRGPARLRPDICSELGQVQRAELARARELVLALRRGRYLRRDLTWMPASAWTLPLEPVRRQLIALSTSMSCMCVPIWQLEDGASKRRDARQSPKQGAPSSMRRTSHPRSRPKSPANPAACRRPFASWHLLHLT